MTSEHSGFIVQIRAQIHQISTEFPLDLLSRTGPQNVTRKTRPERMALWFQAVFHCIVASKQARIHINMAENYSRTIHVTTLRHLNFGPVLRIDFNITSTISVPYISSLLKEMCHPWHKSNTECPWSVAPPSGFLVHRSPEVGWSGPSSRVPLNIKSSLALTYDYMPFTLYCEN